MKNTPKNNTNNKIIMKNHQKSKGEMISTEKYKKREKRGNPIKIP